MQKDITVLAHRVNKIVDRIVALECDRNELQQKVADIDTALDAKGQDIRELQRDYDCAVAELIRSIIEQDNPSF